MQMMQILFDITAKPQNCNENMKIVERFFATFFSVFYNLLQHLFISSYYK